MKTSILVNIDTEKHSVTIKEANADTVTMSVTYDSLENLASVTGKAVTGMLTMASFRCEEGDAFNFENKSAGDKNRAGYFEYVLTGKNAHGRTINSEDLLAGSTTTYSGGVAYTGFCSQTKYANWDDAQAFVAGLNANKVGGKTTWRLLSSKADARTLHDAYFDSGNNRGIGGLHYLWTSVSSGSRGRLWECFLGSWTNDIKSASVSDCGFVVVCGS